MQGNRTLTDGQSETGATNFVIEKMLRQVYTVLPVSVQSVEQPDPTGEVGFVDVVPLIRQVDGEGKAIAVSSLYRLPFFRAQCGKNAVIVNPQPGDKGLALFSMRDVSVLKSSRSGPVQPGSRRYMSAADGFYLGGFLNPAAERYVMIDDEGVTIEGVAKLTMHGETSVLTAESGLTINADVRINGSLTWTGTAQGDGGPARFSGGLTNAGGTVESNGKVLETHIHTGVEPGSGTSGGPQ